MKLTEAKIEANQANAQLSTGPRTEQGKAISSFNSLRHGLTAMTVLLPGEDPAQSLRQNPHCEVERDRQGQEEPRPPTRTR